EDFPFPPQEALRTVDHRRPGLARDAQRGARRQHGGEPALSRRPRIRPQLPGPDPARPPQCPQHLIARPPRHLGGRRRGPGGRPAGGPAGRRDLVLRHIRSGRRLDRLSRTAIVALVTATRSLNGIGMAEPDLTASTNCASWLPWPLSWPPRARMVRCPRPVQVMAFLKLSSRALEPSAAASNVSFGKRTLPVVAYVMTPLAPFSKRTLTWTSSLAGPDTAYTSSGRLPTHQLSVSMKWPPSPVNREPSSASFPYQLSAASGPALTR